MIRVMLTAWTSRSLIASLLLLSACPGEDPPPAEDSSTGPGSTSTGDTPQTSTTMPDSTSTSEEPGTSVTFNPDSTGPDDTTGHNHTTDPGTTTTGPDDTTSTGDSTTGEASTGSTGEASTGGSTTTGGMMVDCTAGDGPDFAVGNNGFSDYVIDGVNDPGITVVRGCSYTFTVNTPGHPFFIKTMQVTGVGSTYNDGVTNNGTQNGVITWDVPLGAPDALFYICQFHAGMTGTITVID